MPTAIIVNRYYPPDSSPIAIAANDLALHLMEQGVDVHIVHTDGQYKGKGKVGLDSGTRHVIKKVYDGKNNVFKLVGNLIEGRRMILKAKKLHEQTKGPVIVMCNPALLNYWAGRIFNKNKIPWMYWSMDLFPEAFVATKLVKPQNIIYKYLFKKVYKNPPTSILALGQIQADYLLDQYKVKPSSIVLPCGVFINNAPVDLENKDLPEWKKGEERIILGYVGNLGIAHSEQFLMWIIDHMDPKKHKLVLRAYGLKTEKIKAYAEGKEGVSFIGFVEEKDLRHIDIHLVSLLSNYVNVCVPSKMVSAVYRGALVLFYGLADCDNWSYLKDAAWRIDIENNPEEEIKVFMNQLSKEKIANKRKEAADMPNRLLKDTKDGYEAVHKFLVNQTKTN